MRITMRFLSLVSFTGAVLLWSRLVSLASSYSLNNKNDDVLLRRQLGQKSIVDQTLRMATTRRETIRMMPNQTPMVPYKPPGSDYTQFIDIESAMYRDRTLMINKFIDDNTANSIIAIILYLRNENPREKISLYFNVPGGMMRPSLAIYDLIQNTKKNCEIETVNLALCAGMGAILCAAGTKGKRSAMPNARFLLQRTGMNRPFRGQATDIALEVKNLKNWNDRMELELSALTGQTPEQISSDLKRDFYLEADKAVQYGLIDRVLLPSPRKRASRGSEADLGTFEGDEAQRYQGENASSNNKGGWGSQQQQQQKPSDRRKKDDDEPEIAKG